jgi:hypothetical protein
MIKVIIGESERELSSVSERWINQQINRRRKDGITVCVKVIIKTGNLNMILSTPTCEPNRVDSRPPIPSEDTLFDLWKKLGLKDSNFTGGNLIAFLKQLRYSL